jgi:hypothetical protein
LSELDSIQKVSTDAFLFTNYSKYGLYNLTSGDQKIYLESPQYLASNIVTWYSKYYSVAVPRYYYEEPDTSEKEPTSTFMYDPVKKEYRAAKSNLQLATSKTNILLPSGPHLIAFEPKNVYISDSDGTSWSKLYSINGTDKIECISRRNETEIIIHLRSEHDSNFPSGFVKLNTQKGTSSVHKSKPVKEGVALLLPDQRVLCIDKTQDFLAVISVFDPIECTWTDEICSGYIPSNATGSLEFRVLGNFLIVFTKLGSFTSVYKAFLLDLEIFHWYSRQFKDPHAANFAEGAEFDSLVGYKDGFLTFLTIENDIDTSKFPVPVSNIIESTLLKSADHVLNVAQLQRKLRKKETTVKAFTY